MEEGKIQWHPAFVAALKIELMEDSDILSYLIEHPLNRKPMLVDTIVIKKEKHKQIRKNIGHIFREYNIFEYKAPGDSMNVNDFYKTYAYACFYQADTTKTEEINPDEITITLACTHYPRHLIEHLISVRGLTITKYAPGIYYAAGTPQLFPIQILVIPQLSPRDSYWMQKLRNDLKSGGEIRDLLEIYEDKKNNDLYQAVMEVVVRANQKEMEVEKKMCQALKELFADEFEKCAEEARLRGHNQGI
ncbi:MAG: 3-isopropylmalate dehydrogenase, partial [Lachnospiraceae bacterium]|nr:3-isopropylmalate dehydrogenase [Lachnospiraceae bacterium]